LGIPFATDTIGRRFTLTNNLIVSLVSGILFGGLDGLIHANPLAVKLLDSCPLFQEPTSMRLPSGSATMEERMPHGSRRGA
jgi:hypothetical protein